jgi:hypothetical protein
VDPERTFADASLDAALQHRQARRPWQFEDHGAQVLALGEEPTVLAMDFQFDGGRTEHALPAEARRAGGSRQGFHFDERRRGQCSRLLASEKQAERVTGRVEHDAYAVAIPIGWLPRRLGATNLERE